MKTILKKGIIWLALSFLMMIFWIAGLFIGNALFPSNLIAQSANTSHNSDWIFFLVCVLDTLIILYLIYNSRYKGIRLALSVFLVTFGIQYFMSQIETIWFNESLKLSKNGIWTIITGGLIMTFLYSISATWITGNFKSAIQSGNSHIRPDFWPLFARIIILSVLVWPAIYFLAGYFIAWQFADVRLFYSGTTDKASFFLIMKNNFNSGLYFFQIFRGFMWILIGCLVLLMTKGSLFHKGIILGLLFTVLGSSGLLIPNPVMPFTVRMAHFVETVPSSFLWGFIIAWFFWKYTIYKTIDSDLNSKIIKSID